MSGKQQKRAKTRQVIVESAKPRVANSLLTWVQKFSTFTFVLLVLIGSLRIVTTYSVFNHTIDEPAHIACGMEWMDKGVYRYEPQHPPLARVATAIGPFLAGRHTEGRPDIYNEGAAILYRDGHYYRNLTLARLGILPFFWIAALVVYLWSRKYLGEPSAILAVFLFTFLPPILAHAGLATTDMALTAFLGAGFFSMLVWIERPNPSTALLFGACVGLAVVSKFSTVAFLPLAFLAALVWYLAAERPSLSRFATLARERILTFGLAVVVGFVVIWAAYRFSFGPVPFTKIPLPFAELYAGIRQVLDHNAMGHPTYLLGDRSNTGWWYYYPVVLAVKTPLAFLAFLGIGCAMAFSKAGLRNKALWLPLCFSLGILAVSFGSRINIGVRHILPMYIGFAIVAAVGAARLLERARQAKWAAWTLGLLLFWTAATSVLAHPDYIPYFNLLAGDEPEKVLVDSDLDWGQDMDRLARRLQEVGARQVTFNPFIRAYLEAVHGFPPIQPTDPQTPSPGRNAVSLTVLKLARLGLYDQEPRLTLWPDQIKPTERVGKTTLLFYVPPAQPSRR